MFDKSLYPLTSAYFISLHSPPSIVSHPYRIYLFPQQLGLFSFLRVFTCLFVPFAWNCFPRSDTVCSFLSVWRKRKCHPHIQTFSDSLNQSSLSSSWLFIPSSFWMFFIAFSTFKRELILFLGICISYLYLFTTRQVGPWVKNFVLFIDVFQYLG